MGTDWIKGQPQFATEKDLKGQWGFQKEGKGFSCKLCGHKFELGDYWRFVYANGVPGAGTGNFLVCENCDSTNTEVIEKAKSQLAVAKRWIADK
jgi:hypothetical protein